MEKKWDMFPSRLFKQKHVTTHPEKVSQYVQKIPQSKTADKPMAP